MTRNARPNIVLLMADDLGVGDLCCYGNNSVSKDYGANLLTPVNLGMVSPYNLNRALTWLGGSGGLPTNETTFAKLLQHRGYRTGLIGKWHLGLSCASRNDHCYHPLNHGFHYFYGVPFGLLSDCQASKTPELHRWLRIKLWISTVAIALVPFLLLIPKFARWFSVPWKVIFVFALLAFLFFTSWYSSYGFTRRWNCILMRNHEIIQQPMKEEKVASLMLKEALAFIERVKREPFLLFFSFLHVHTPLISKEKFVGHSKYGRYGDNVEEMDWMVGKILGALDRECLANNTLVYFTSDNGGHLEPLDGAVQLGGWNGIYKGGKGMGGWEGGIRVPGIFRWPSVLEAGRVINEPTSLMDIYPTLSYIGGGILPQDRYGNILKSPPRWYHNATYFLGATVWKAHYVTPKFYPDGTGACSGSGICSCSGDVTYHDPPLLFDISRDPSEAFPLNPDNEPLFDSVIKKMEAAIKEHRRTLTPVPQQFSVFNTIWKPWLQPCCGTFPFCGCDKEDDILPTAP
uniref:Arylsulfatase family member H n=1 Tax=Cercocebus atys TaxID=9531 RepID=A0A2K5MEP0_CERAT